MNDWLRTARRIARAATSLTLAGCIAILAASTSARALPIEDAYEVAGPWAVSTAEVTDGGGVVLYNLFYPTNLGAGGTRHPIITWGNGTAAVPTQYLGLLNQLASWGFVIVASTSQTTAKGFEMLAGVNYMIAADSDPGSIFHDKLDTGRIGAIGHSQGAGGTINSTNLSGGLIKTAVPIALPAQIWVGAGDNFSVAQLTVPVLFLSGSTDTIISSPATNTGYYNQVPGAAAKAVLIGAGHNTIQGTGGNFLGYITAWMRYQLADDTVARGAFVGSPAEITVNSAWNNVATKSLPECVSDAMCSDGLLCNGVEACSAGLCAAGVVPDCSLVGSDADCTTGECVEPTGCVATPDPSKAGTVCRPGSGDVCNPPEFCTADAQCPEDVQGSASTVCRPSEGACDEAETCAEILTDNGPSHVCPADGVKPASAVCRGAAGACDVAETCDGTSVLCPADALRSAGAVCRDLAGSCDVAETCDGSSTECSEDVFASAATVCRASIGECDPSELCTGGAAQCPGNVVVDSGTACTPDDDACTVDACDGAGACAHTPSQDTDQDGACDGIDPCTNVGGARNFLTSPKSKTAFSKVNTQTVPGDDGLTLKAAFDLPLGRRFSDLAPDTQGVRVSITSRDGEPLVDVTLAGTHTGKGTRGWTRAKNGKSWSFADQTATPANGIVQMKLTDKTSAKTPQRVQVAVVGKKGSYPVLDDDAPLRVTLTLGSQADAALGLCTESIYIPASCTWNRVRSSVSCIR